MGGFEEDDHRRHQCSSNFRFLQYPTVHSFRPPFLPRNWHHRGVHHLSTRLLNQRTRSPIRDLRVAAWNNFGYVDEKIVKGSTITLGARWPSEARIQVRRKPIARSRLNILDYHRTKWAELVFPIGSARQRFRSQGLIQPVRRKTFGTVGLLLSPRILDRTDVTGGRRMEQSPGSLS